MPFAPSSVLVPNGMFLYLFTSFLKNEEKLRALRMLRSETSFFAKERWPWINAVLTDETYILNKYIFCMAPPQKKKCIWSTL